MLLTNWLKSLTSRYRTVRSRRPRNQRSRARHRYQPALSRRPIAIEELEDRTLLTSLISIDDVSIQEDDGSSLAIFTITRTGNSPGDLNSTIAIDFTTRDGTATAADDDYNSVAGQLHFFSHATAVSQTTTMAVLIFDDNKAEGDETFQLVLSSTAGDTYFTKNIGTATIVNDDGVWLSINDTSGYEYEPLTFTVSLNRAAEEDITFRARTLGGSASIDVYENDYTYFRDKPFTIKAGEVSKEFSIYPHNEDRVEPDETVTIEIYEASYTGGSLTEYVQISDDRGVATILNDDGLPGSIFRIEDSKVTEGDAGTQTLTFTVTREGGSAGDLNFESTVQFQTSDKTAVSGEDYAATTQTLTFSASPTETRQTMLVEVLIFGDRKTELSETFLATLSNPTGGSILRGDAATLQAKGVITNDETEFSFQQSFSASPEFADHSYDNIGRHMAVSGDILVIGVPNKYANQDNAPGAAYIYRRNEQGTPQDQADDTWDYVTYLRPADQPGLTYFGGAVAIDQDTIVIGGLKDGQGMVYVYSMVGADWVTTSPQRDVITVDPFIDDPDEYFHSPLGIDDNTIVAGSWVIERTGADWSTHAKRELMPTNDVDTYGDTLFGWSAAISGDIIVIGAPQDSEREERAGAAYVYIKNGNSWTTNPPEAVKLLPSTRYFEGAGFGIAVATNGTEVAVGATYDSDPNDGYDNYHQGNVYIYTPDGSDWTSAPPVEAVFKAPTFAYGYGGSIVLTDTQLLVGAISQYESSTGSYGYESGKVYLYTKDGIAWDQNTASRTLISVLGQFGETIAFSGTTLVAGMPLESTEQGVYSGLARVYELQQDNTFLLTSEIIPTETATAYNGADGFGDSIAFNEKYLVIGSPYTERYSTLKPDYPISGVVYVYEKDDGGTPENSGDDRWVFQTILEAPEADFVGAFGKSVEIEGNTILVAANSRRLNGSGMHVSDAEVYIFEMSGTDWVTQPPEVTPLLDRVNRSFDWGLRSDDYLAIQGDTIVVGNAYGNDSVYIYRRYGSHWFDSGINQFILQPSKKYILDDFGATVALDHDKIVVSATYNNSIYRESSLLYLFEKGATGWNTAQETILTGFSSLPSDGYGYSLAISDNTIAVAAALDNQTGQYGGAVYIYDGATGWDQPVEIKLTPVNVANQDPFYTPGDHEQRFGLQIDLVDDLLMVGTYATSPESSAIYLYDGSEGWDQLKETRIPYTSIDPEYKRGFGTRVALGQNELIVTSLDSLTKSDVSHVYSFSRPAAYEDVVHTDSLIPPAPVADGDHYGSAIEVEGDYMFVAAVDSALEAPYAGAVYVYQRNRQGTPESEADDTWDYHSTLTAPNAVLGDQFGISLASDGDTLVIGAYLDDEMGEDSGAAYVYRLNGSTWELEEKLTASDTDAGDHFGVSVAIENDTILVGATFWDSSFVTNNYDDGAAYVFTRTGSDWSETQRLTASNNSMLDRFGNDVAIQNGTLFVSAVSADVGDSPLGAGAVYLFEQIAGTWQEQQILGPPDGVHNDVFGSDIHVDGDYLGVVAFGDDDNKGSAYLFVNNAGTWEFQQKLIPPVDNDADRSIYALRISGQTLVIGGRFSDGVTTDSGAAFLYKLVDDQWVESQKLTAADGAFQDFFGHAVAFSETEVIVGAPLHDEASNDAGKVYVFGSSGPSVSISNASMLEGDAGQSYLTFTVERRATSPGDLYFESTINFSTADLTATVADGDYVFQSGTITFPADLNAVVQTQTIQILVNGDTAYEGDESFLVQLSDPSEGTRLLQSEAEGMIEDDDHFLVSIADVTINESDNTATLVVSLDQAVGEEVSVDYSTSAQTAQSSFDFQTTSGTLVFAPGETSKTIQISIIDDTDQVEADETFLVNLVNLQAATSVVLFADQQAAVTIQDNDQAAMSVGNFTIVEDAGTVDIVVTLDKAVDTTITVYYATADQSAVAGSDYSATTGTLSFAPGELSQTISIPLVDSTAVELDEIFLVNLSNLQANGLDVILDNTQAEVTITDDDQAQITIDDVTVNEANGTANIVVSLDRAIGTTLKLDYETADQSAFATVDYLAKSGTLTFTPGDLTQTITISLINTSLVEATEKFLVNLSNLQNNGFDVVLADNQAEITIIDDDQAQLQIYDVSYAESVGTAQVQVVLSKPLDTEISIDFTTVDQTASSPENYQSVSGTLTFAVGQQLGTINIPLVDNDQVGADVNFAVNLSQLESHGANIVLADDQAEVTIVDDDQANGSVFSIDSQKILEGADGTQYLQFTITRTGLAAGDLNFDSQVQFNTIDGTATAGEDYASTSQTLYFNDHPTDTVQTQTVEIPIWGDTFFEYSETIIGRLSAPTFGSVLEGKVPTLDAVGVIASDESEFTFQQSFSADPLFANHSYDSTGRYYAIDGDVMVIGVPNNHANEDNAPGTAYIYQRNQQGTPADQTDDTWDFQAILRPEFYPGLQYFGRSVAIHDDTILVGARDDDGRVLYIFTRVGDDWSTSPAIRESFATPTEDYLSGPTDTPLAVFDDTIVAANYLFEKTGADWSNPAVTILTTSIVSSIAMQENTIVLGSSYDGSNGYRTGAVMIYTKSGSGWTTSTIHETKITASDAASYEYFGQSVSIDGDQLAVGAMNPLTSTDLGKVYIYTKNGADWHTVAPDEVMFQADAGVYHFGASVSLQDNHLVIGTYNREYALEASDVYVYTRNGGSWNTGTANRTVLSAPVDGNLLFGEKVFITGTTIFVGAPLTDTNGDNSGSIYVFDLNQSDNYELIHEISPDVSETAHNGGDEFGRRVVVSEDYLLIAATGSDSSDVTGVVYLYVKDNGGTTDSTDDDRWVYETTFTAPDPATTAGFGHSLAIDGDTILIAAKKTNSLSEVYVYEKMGADWTTNSPRITPLLSSTSTFIIWYDDAARYPESFLAIQNGTIVVSDPFSTIDPSDAGQVYVFTRNGDDWSGLDPDRAILKASDGTVRNEFGYHIDLDDDKIIVGADRDNSYQGAAYLYLKGENGWDDATEIKLVGTGTEIYDQFGATVAIDGNTVVVSAIDDNDSGSAAGAIYIYDASQGWDNLVETKVIPAMIRNQDQYYGVGTYTQNFGGSIDVEGTTIVVGASSAGANSNAVYIYDGSEGWDQIKESRISLPEDSEIYDRGFGATVAYHNDNLIVALHDKLTHSDVARVYSFTRPPRYHNLIQSQTEIPPAPLADADHVGNAIAVDGDFMAVAADKSNLADTDAGVVYIYQRNRNDIDNASDDTWEYHSTLTAFDAQAGDQFGVSVALDGDTLVIGAFRENSLGNESGAVYVYRLNGSTWEYEEKLTASDGEAGDFFGRSVAIENNIVVVGANYRDSDTTTDEDTGAVYVFSRTGSTWSEVQKLTASNAAVLDRFGTAVAIQNGTIFVSAIEAQTSGTSPQSGAVYIFHQNAGSWQEAQILSAPDGENNDTFGSDLHVQGNYLGVIAAGDDELKGSAYLFVNRGGTWEFQQKLTPPESDDADRSVSSIRISGTTLAIGGRYSDGNVTDSGAVFVYRLINEQWTPVQTLKADDGLLQDFFGYAVAFSDTEVIVGAPYNDAAGQDTGKFYIFRPFSPETSITSVSQSEGDAGDTVFTFQVERRGLEAGDLNFESTVDFMTADLTASLADNDYEYQTGTVTFLADPDTLIQTATIEIIVHGDTIIESDETFTVTLYNPSNGTVLTDDSATATIVDDDLKAVSIEDTTINEANGLATITLRLTYASAGRTTVEYATADLTALAGSDYTSTTGTVTFEAGELSKTITIPILNNPAVEGNEIFLVNLTNLVSETSDVVISDDQAEVTILDDDQASLSIDDLTVGESVGTASLTVTLSQPSETTVTVDFTTSDQSATDSADYQAQSGTLTLSPGELSKTITVSIIDSDMVELEERLSVLLSNIQSGGADVVFAKSLGEITIQDNDQARMTVDDVTVDEDTGTVELTVSLDHPVDTTISVEYATADLSAIAGDDYTPQTGTLTFSPFTLTRTISIPIVNSDLVELEKSFFVNLSNLLANGRDVILADSQAEVTISDDDQALVTIDDIIVNEADGTAEVTVSLDKPVASEISVDYTTAGQSALDTEDFESQSGTLTFTVGQQTRIISIPLVNNEDLELDESFSIILSDLQNHGFNVVLADAQAEVTIEDDEQARFSIADIDVNEADGTAVLTGTLDTPLPVTVTVDFTTSNLTAVSPDDYQSTSGTLTFLPGELSQTITIDIVDSDLLEIDETFLVSLSNLQSGTANVILGDGQAEVTIHDNDQASLTIDDVTVDENAGSVLLTVSLDQAAGDTISIDYATADQSAVADDDYSSQTGTLTFAPGVLTQTISIPIVDSDLVELDESFLVNLSNLQTNGWNVSLTDAQAVVTISDDDQAQLTIDDISINESEGTAEVTVSLDQPVAGEISVHFETADQTAIAGEDYEGQSGTITFSAGQQTRIISIPLIDTNHVEPDEQFLINLSQLQNNGYDVVLADAQAEVTIRDDDQAQFTIDDIIVSEADGTAVLTVSLSHPVTSTVTIDYATADDSALSPEDYQAQTGTLTFLPGVQSQSITIDLINSAPIELDERFLVNLSNIQAGSADVVIGDHQGEVTIQDNEQAQLIVSDLTVNEADGTAEVVVTLDQPVSFEVRVNYSLADGKAKNSLDYQSQSGTLTFAPGEQSKTITVALIDNDKVEEIEDFHVNLSGLNIQSDVVIIGRSQADVSIVDDDQAQFSITDITVDEAAGIARLYIYLTDTVYANISVDYSTVDQSAVSDSDYLGKSGRLTFTQGQTAKSLTITITDDQIVEGLESFYVQLSNIQANGAQLTFANDSGKVTIEDNDEANLTMSDVTVDESAGVALVSLTLDQPVEAAVSLDFNTLDQSARANADYQPTAGTVTFQPGEVSQTVSIPLIDTDLVELTESFLVQFTNLQAGGANIALSRNQAEVTVTDDDQSNITIDDISVDESAANVQVTVSLDAPVDASVVINYATASQTAQSPSDYAHRSGSLTFTPGTQTQTISIPLVDSGLLEIDETFLVILSGLQASGRNVILADDRAVVTILDDDSASAEVNLRLVSSPTPTQPDGSIIQLPEHETWVSEWATWWIEIWVQTNDQTSQGSISVDVDLSYNSAVASAMEIEYGPRFSTNQAGNIDDSAGTITDLHAETSTAGLQVNRRTLFARIRFTPQLQDQIDLDLSEKVLPAEDLELQANSVEVQLSNAAPFVTPIEAIPAVQIYANPYDLNNDDAINFRDLLLFASVYNSTPSQSDSDYAWFADLNQDDRVNFRDLLLFASNYGKSKANQSIVTYPSNFPDAWNQFLVADTSSAPQQTSTPLTQTVATASFSRIVDQVSGSLTEEQNVMLEATTVQVVDLEGDALGRVAGGTIYIDVDAAGYGWYLEGSPAADFNFVYDSDLSLIALPGSDADGRFDLQTVLFHELGHLLGYDHAEDGVMQDTLAPGIRLLPDWELNFEFDPGLSLEDTDEFFLDIQDETELMPFK
ncbi:MAG: dockerin type I domain-containing protein [bacterium]|nr:dockerin type I domain-containing protein [bacterium]